MLQPQLFGRELLAFPKGDRNRRCIGAGKDLERGSVNFDLARFHLRISHLGGAKLNASGYLDDAFLAERGSLRDQIGGSPTRIERNLYEARAVAKVHEHQSAKIPDAVNPTAEGDLLPGMGGAKLTTKVSAL
jgi:hypothetical protein